MNFSAVKKVYEKRRYHLCTICGTGSKTKQALDLHMKHKHTGERPHMCSECDYKAVTNGSLLHHMRVVHEKLKPFSCPEDSCDYKAATKVMLKQHIERHTGVKPYDCALCNTKFYTKYEKKRHIAAVHEK